MEKLINTKYKKVKMEEFKNQKRQAKERETGREKGGEKEIEKEREREREIVNVVMVWLSVCCANEKKQNYKLSRAKLCMIKRTKKLIF